jgi:hypothetical protein
LVFFLPKIPQDVLEDALCTSPYFTHEEAKYVVRTIGPHMGHIEDVIRNLSYGHTGTLKGRHARYYPGKTF